MKQIARAITVFFETIFELYTPMVSDKKYQTLLDKSTKILADLHV